MSIPQIPHPRARTRVRARALPFVACVGAMLVLAACSSSSSPTSSATAGSAASASASSSSGSQASGTPYTIGTIAGVTGAYGPGLGGSFQVATAWEKWTNAHGGVNGHPVNIITKDDGGVPANGIAAAESLVSNPKVLAIVSPASNTSNAWYSVAAKAQMPVVGGTVWSNAYQTESTWFPTGTTQGGYGKAVLYAMRKLGKTKLAVVVCVEVPSCATYGQEFISAGKTFASQLGGAKVVYYAAVSSSAPNYTSTCLAAKQAGADAMLVGDSAPVGLRVYSDCASQGYHPLIMATSGSYDPTWENNPVVDGAQFVNTAFPFWASDLPSQQDFQTALKEYAPGVLQDQAYLSNASIVWSSFEFWGAAMEHANLGANPTKAEVTQAMRSLPAGFSVPGITTSVTYNTSGSGGNPEIYCYFGGTIASGKFATVNGGNSQCPTNLGP
jgi:branched-chain amino acid transport system substrate-binding protein